MGLMMIKKFRPNLIWSTYPIATAHLIGLTLHRITGLPWVADFRDSMTEADYPANETTRRIYRWIERRTVARAARVVFTTPGAIRIYSERYPEQPDYHWVCIPNGYDELAFSGAERLATSSKPANGGAITLLHSGVLYPSERDPTKFFAALAELHRSGDITSSTLQVVLRATGHDQIIASMISKYELESIVSIQGGIDYEDALVEMLGADGLLIFQASNCNHQIPAKIYEYLRTRRPILALTDPAGDTAQTLFAAGVHMVVRLDDKVAIKEGIVEFMKRIRDRTAPIADEQVVRQFSRKSQTEKLARTLDEIIDESD
jgi:hypothetical protein